MDVCNNMFENKLNWTTARAMGLGLWLRNPDSLVSFCIHIFGDFVLIT